MSDESTFDPAHIIFRVLVGLLLCAIGFAVSEHFHNRDAIRQGRAYYSVDPLSGTTTFTWKTNCICK